jgi:hypothetical protein
MQAVGRASRHRTVYSEGRKLRLPGKLITLSQKRTKTVSNKARQKEERHKQTAK